VSGQPNRNPIPAAMLELQKDVIAAVDRQTQARTLDEFSVVSTLLSVTWALLRGNRPGSSDRDAELALRHYLDVINAARRNARKKS
jgi:hypothetical protein